jgi:bifunctional DNase/RNase
VDAEPDPATPADPDPRPLEQVEATGSAEPAGPADLLGSPATAEPEPAPPPVAAAAAEELVELALASVDLAPEGQQPAIGTVSLMDMAGGGRLDIVMARADAALVQEAIAGLVPPRPRTHDLLVAAVFALGGAVVGVTLVERRAGGIYVASVRVRRQDGSVAELDARPSDALNVALRSSGAVLRAARSLIDVPAN